MPPSSKIDYTSAHLIRPSTKISRQGYISYELRLVGYKNSRERIVLVRCLAPDCAKTWDIKASQATSTGNMWGHIQKNHPDWDPLARSGLIRAQSNITSFSTTSTSASDHSGVIKDGLERRLIAFLTQNHISINSICSTSFRELINYEKRLVYIIIIL